jgi:hypothetical protein
MEVIRSLMRKPNQTDMLAMGAFGVAVIYALFRGTLHTVIAGIAFFLIVLGALPKMSALAFLVGASVIVLLQTRRRWEGFADASGATEATEAATANATATPAEEDKEEEATATESATEENFSAPIASDKPMLPDNRDRLEPLVLGKPYKLPNESDDKGYHLDAGTTFLNAYKALKPDQIASMTKDTQELLSTQKSLVSMLDSFGPLLKDMNKITGFFGNSK